MLYSVYAGLVLTVSSGKSSSSELSVDNCRCLLLGFSYIPVESELSLGANPPRLGSLAADPLVFLALRTGGLRLSSTTS